MNYLLFLTLLFPNILFAQCPNEIQFEGTNYCMDINWEYGERKIRGEFQSTDTLSPFLVPMGEVPQKWIFSKSTVSIWQKRDANQTLVEIPNFKIFPFMHMENGHNHSTGYDLFFDSETKTYVLRRIAFQQMRGCWSLRWTTAAEDSKASSQFVMNLTDFVNLTEEESRDLMHLCEKIGDGSGHGGHHEH